jgi:predicted permease
MSFWRQVTRGLRSLLNRSAADRDIADEVEHYFDEAAESFQATGLSLEEARRAVRLEFGHARRIQERVRAYGWEHVVDTVGADLRYGARQLYRRPAFALAAVLTLALGIGATTAIFSVVYSVLIKPLPYPNADELVRVRYSSINHRLSSSYTMYLTYRDENRTFASIGLWQYGKESATLTERGTPTRVNALRVTNGTLRALGVQPMRGRWFTNQEYGPAAEGPAPVILSYAFWQRRFGGDDAAMGRDLSIDSEPSRVVGIMPRDFTFLDAAPQPDVILAVRRLYPAEQSIGWFNYQMLGRLNRGVTPDEARADLERMLPIWLNAWPLVPGGGGTKAEIANWRITPVVQPLKDDLVGSIASTLWVLMGAIGAVLLIACANIANLTLVRADARRPELAMRAALGARPRRIAGELLVESLVLGAAGGVIGVLLAYVGLQGLIAIGPSELPRLHEISVHPPVLAFAMAVSLASALVFGSITALKHALHIDTHVVGAGRGASASRERNATRSALVVVQVALALVLVVSAGLMIRSFQALRDIDPGFSDPATIQTASIWMPGGPNVDPADPLEWTRTQQAILDKIAALPGVTSVGFTDTLPMEGASTVGTEVEGQPLGRAGAPPRQVKRVSPGYFKAMGTRIIAGRDITWGDIQKGGRVVVISENFAREIAAQPAGALGRRIRAPVGSRQWREVVGVVQSVHEDGLYEEPPTFVYYPVLMENRFGSGYVAFVIRSERAGTASLMSEVRQAVTSVNGTIPITLERTMQDVYADSLARTSFTLVMLAIAGGMALVLGIIGIYGVIASIVSQRTREIGIRSALGASPRELERVFLLHGLALSGVGAAAGLVAAVALRRVMSSLLFGIGPMDPAAYAAALGVTIAAATLASYVPARRAAMIDPMLTMKAE